MVFWASRKNHEESYNAKFKGEVSYKGTKFGGKLFYFCKENGVKTLFEIASGNGRLKCAATSIGMDAYTLCFDPLDADFVQFDLSSSELNHAKILSKKIKALSGSALSVTTCLDVLEHIEIEDIGIALLNLSKVVGDFGVFSILTRPSSSDNGVFATILPFQTWIYLLELVGFEILDKNFHSDREKVVYKSAKADDSILARHWAEADIFKDRSNGAQTYVLVKKKKNNENYECVRDRIDEILDITYRKRKREKVKNLNFESVVININHPQ
jgi:hypothetical protein